jgi:hypothetical protein
MLVYWQLPVMRLTLDARSQFSSSQGYYFLHTLLTIILQAKILAYPNLFGTKGFVVVVTGCKALISSFHISGLVHLSL